PGELALHADEGLGAPPGARAAGDPRRPRDARRRRRPPLRVARRARDRRHARPGHARAQQARRRPGGRPVSAAPRWIRPGPPDVLALVRAAHGGAVGPPPGARRALSARIPLRTIAPHTAGSAGALSARR